MADLAHAFGRECDVLTRFDAPSDRQQAHQGPVDPQAEEEVDAQRAEQRDRDAKQEEQLSVGPHDVQRGEGGSVDLLKVFDQDMGVPDHFVIRFRPGEEPRGSPGAIEPPRLHVGDHGVEVAQPPSIGGSADRVDLTGDLAPER